MKFLFFVWLPWWLFVGLYAFGEAQHYSAYKQGAMGVYVFGYGAVAGIITFVYVLTRVFRRASRDAERVR